MIFIQRRCNAKLCGCVKQKSVFEHVQNMQIQIILHMHRVSSELLLSIHTFCIIKWVLLSDPIRVCANFDLGLRYPHMPEDLFLYGAANINIMCLLGVAVAKRLALLLLNTTCPVLANSVDPDQVASEK